MNQLSFNLQPARARSNDPLTSFEAADKVNRFAHRHYQIILNYLLEHGASTPKEIAANTRLDSVQVTRRLSGLGKKGLARVVYSNGELVKRDGCRVWEAI